MSFRGVLAAVAAGALAAVGLAGPAAAADQPQHRKPDYYVSLGDSLAAGYQPDVKRDTDVSYTDQLYARLRARDPRLVHIKLGCSGETTQTMISGGICSYPGGLSQLAYAERFLRAHRGQVRFVTIDIGANDVDGCAPGGSIDAGCLVKGIATVAQQEPQITRALRRAGGDRVAYAGMDYYNPFLAYWLTGATGQATAVASAPMSAAFNAAVDSGLRAGGFRVADVARAFSSDDFIDQAQLPGVGGVPLNVARICQWTWECTPYHDIHATPVGHAVIARVFQRVLARDDD
jgi:lysophospholipase L1-like esterase